MCTNHVCVVHLVAGSPRLSTSDRSGARPRTSKHSASSVPGGLVMLEGWTRPGNGLSMLERGPSNYLGRPTLGTALQVPSFAGRTAWLRGFPIASRRSQCLSQACPCCPDSMKVDPPRGLVCCFTRGRGSFFWNRACVGHHVSVTPLHAACWCTVATRTGNGSGPRMQILRTAYCSYGLCSYLRKIWS